MSVNFSSFRQVKPRREPGSNMAASLKYLLVTRLIDVTLAAILIVLAKDVSPSPGPAFPRPCSTEGLRIYHLNIHSQGLRNKLDVLRLFFN